MLFLEDGVTALWPLRTSTGPWEMADSLTWGRYIDGPVVVGGHRAKPTGMTVTGASPFPLGFSVRDQVCGVGVSLFLAGCGKLVFGRSSLSSSLTCSSSRFQFFILGDRFAQSCFLSASSGSVEIGPCWPHPGLARTTSERNPVTPPAWGTKRTFDRDRLCGVKRNRSANFFHD